MKRMIFCLLTAMLLLACGKGSGDNTPKGIVSQYAEAIIDGDYRSALDLVYFDGTEEEAQEMREKFVKLCEEVTEAGIKDHDKLVQYVLGEEKVNEEEGKATIETTLSYADGHSKTETIKLRKDEQGQWFIDEEE